MAMILFFLVALIGLPVRVGGLSQVAAIPEGSLFAGTVVNSGDAIEKIDGERFGDFAAFYESLAGYERDTVEFSLLRQGEWGFIQGACPCGFRRATQLCSGEWCD